ncbi:MAG TPA: hypothetical protein VJ810_04525 [Blastocatellia bacterium]|nr:hypothetical protein [Blastocatellia bacterium]
MRGNLIRHNSIIRSAAVALLGLCTVHSPAHAYRTAINAGVTLDSHQVFSADHKAVVVLSLDSSPSAQTPRERLGTEPPQQEPQQTEEEKKAAKELEKKTMALIDELVAEAMTLRLVENRVYILTSASELLWAHDEERARSIARKAMDQVAADLRKAMEKSAQEEGQYFDARYFRHYDASLPRHMVMDLLTRWDAKLALEFLQLTRSILQIDDSRDPEVGQQERALEMDLASEIAENDSQSAMRIAGKYLGDNLDHQVFRFWNVLLRKDPKAASKLTEKIISELKSQNILANYEASAYVFGVLHVLRLYANQVAGAQNDPEAANAPQLNSAEIKRAYRDLLEFVVASALKITVNNLINRDEADIARSLLETIPNFLTDIEKLFPSRVAAVRAKVAQFDKARRRNPHDKLHADYETDLYNKSPQELVGLASKAPQEMRQNIYSQAIHKAIDQDDEETARKIIKENIRNKLQANDLLSNLDRRNAERAVSEGKYAEARKSLARMGTDEQRALALAKWSSAAAGNGDGKSAREMFEEARSLIGSRMQRNNQFEAQMAVADAALNLNVDVSFEIAEAAIERINRLVAAELELQTFNSGVVGEGEIRVKDGFLWNAHSNSIVSLIATLARKDFDRAVDLLRRWRPKEMRLEMSLEFVQNIPK